MKFIFTKLLEYLSNLLNNTSFFFDWLGNPTGAFWAFVIVDTWHMAGYVMFIYIASIGSIPDDIIEASEIDGANS